MKAAVMEGMKQFVIKDVPKPTAGESEVLVRVRACAICGSDLSLYKMGAADRILGHEFAGEIAETGQKVNNWKAGDRVVVEPSLVCGECHWCKKQQYNLCNSLQYTGLATDGAFAEFAKVPAYQLHHLPDGISYEEGALIEPLAVAIHGVQLSELAPGDSVAVFGCGAVGLFAMLWARYRGARQIIATDIAPSRVSTARKLADVVLNPAEVDIEAEILKLTDNVGPHTIYECSGNSEAQLQAINVVRKGGQIILLGIGYEPTPVMFLQVIMREIGIKGSLGYSSLAGDGEFITAIQALRSRQIDMRSIPAQTYRLEEVGKAFESLSHGDIAKAILLP